MDFKTFCQKIWNIIEKILPCVIIVLVVTFGVNQCRSGNYKHELELLQNTTDDIKQSIDELGVNLRQQESIITELRNSQSGLESTVNNLTDSVSRSNEYFESVVGESQSADGFVGAIRGTVNNIEQSIDLSLRAIESSGNE